MNRKLVVTALLAAAAMAPATSEAQEAAPGPSERVYIESTSLFSILVQLPENYEPDREYPLIVGLHGHGARADGFFEPAAPLTSRGGVIYAVPQAPYAYGRAGGLGYSWNLRDVDDTAEQAGDAVTIAYILDVVDAMRARYRVGKVFLMGFSQGGEFAYRTAIGHHQSFDGIIAFGSRFNPDWFEDGQLKAARHLRVFVAGGNQDSNAQLEPAREALEGLGYQVDLYEFRGGHVISFVAIERMVAFAKR